MPSCTEWKVLEDYLAIICFVLNDTKLDEKETEINIANLLTVPTDWANGTEPGLVGNPKNHIGFYGLPSGFRSHNGPFKSITKSGYWWCENITNNMLVYSHSLSYDKNVLDLNLGFKWRGLSVRCVKD